MLCNFPHSNSSDLCPADAYGLSFSKLALCKLIGPARISKHIRPDPPSVEIAARFPSNTWAHHPLSVLSPSSTPRRPPQNPWNPPPSRAAADAPVASSRLTPRPPMASVPSLAVSGGAAAASASFPAAARADARRQPPSSVAVADKVVGLSLSLRPLPSV